MIHCSRRFYRDSYRAVRDYLYYYDKFDHIVHLFPKVQKEDGLSINPMNIIKQSSNKIQMNKIFKKLKIPHPKIYTRRHLFKRKRKYIIKPICGSGGKGKKIVDHFPRKLDWKKNFVQEYYQHNTHLRLYWLNKTFYWCVFKRGHGLIRNEKSGWMYYTIQPLKYLFYRDILNIEDYCAAYQKYTGIIFFAVDIAVDHGKWKFLEVNAMPQLAGNTKRIKAFIKRLKKMF